MNIHEIRQKIKSGRVVEAILITGIIISMAIIAFCLGRLSVLPKDQNSASVKIIVPSSNLIMSYGQDN